MRTKEQLEARVAELDKQVELFGAVVVEQKSVSDANQFVQIINILAKERDTIKWCLDEFSYPYPKALTFNPNK
jgi:hypothetical protein